MLPEISSWATFCAGMPVAVAVAPLLKMSTSVVDDAKRVGVQLVPVVHAAEPVWFQV